MAMDEGSGFFEGHQAGLVIFEVYYFEMTIEMGDDETMIKGWIICI